MSFSITPILEWSKNGYSILSPGASKISGDALDHALNQAGSPKKIILALSRRNSYLKTVWLPDVDRSEAAQVLKFRVSEELFIKNENLAYDFEFLEERGPEGRKAILYGADAELIREAKAELQKHGCKVEAVIPVGVGASTLVSQDEPTLVLDKTLEGISFDVVEDGKTLYSRVSGSSIEKIDLDQEIMRTLSSAGISSAKVCICPGIESTNAQESLESSTLEGVRNLTSNLNILLPEEAKQKSRSKADGRRQLALLFLVAAVAVWGLTITERLDKSDAVKIAERNASEKMRSLTSLDKDIEAKLEKSDAQMALVTNAYEPKQYMSDVLILVSNASPDDIWLTAITTERGKPLQIRGTSLRPEAISEYIDQLSSSSRLRDVKLVFSNKNTIGDTTVHQFSISAHLVGNFPLTDPNKDKKRSR